MKTQLSDLLGQTLFAKDGIAGTIEDVLVDPEDSFVRYVVVKTEHDRESNLSIVSPSSIEVELVDGRDLKLKAPKLRREQIRKYGSIDKSASTGLSRKEELQIANRFLWPIYWLGRENNSEAGKDKECNVSMSPSGVVSLKKTLDAELDVGDDDYFTRDLLIDLDGWIVNSSIVGHGRLRRTLTALNTDDLVQSTAR